MDSEKRRERMFSRRQFLKGVPLGVAGAFAFSLLGGKILSRVAGRRDRGVKYPEGSMFKPARDKNTKI